MCVDRIGRPAYNSPGPEPFAQVSAPRPRVARCRVGGREGGRHQDSEVNNIEFLIVQDVSVVA